MLRKAIPALLFLVGVICVVYASFDCRRRGQSCQNGGTCPDNDTDCLCSTGFKGYDCSINETQIDIGACNETKCENGGTCVETDVNVTSCVCPPEYYGNTCSLKRYQVTCKSGSLLVGINPAGNFSGYIYVEKQRENCTFGKVDGTKGNETKDWEGFAKDIGNKEESCSVIGPVSNPEPENVTLPENATTTYTRVVYVVYEKTFVTSLDEVLTFTCIFDTNSVDITQKVENTPFDVKDLNQKTTTAPLSPVKFEILDKNSAGTRGKRVKLGEELTMKFTVDSKSFDAARLESCVFNDTRISGDILRVVDGSCVRKDAKSILSKPIAYSDDNTTITITLKIRVFKFVESNKLGIVCKVKACPLGKKDDCDPRNCSNELGNQEGYGRRKRDAPEPDDIEMGVVIEVEDSSLPKDTNTEPTTDNTETTSTPTCSMAKEVAAILAALGTVTLILLIITIVLLSRAVITSQSSKAKSRDEPSDTYSNLGQPNAFSRKH